MEYVVSLGIILLFSLFGEILRFLIPLPIPASIYGMILLFLALKLKIVKIEKINSVAHYLISIMLIFFIMPAVSIMDSFELINGKIISMLIAIILPTIIVIIVTGLVTQIVEKATLKFSKKRKELTNGSNN